ncbi:hypothetical protein FVE85_2980 [Porphyridium purpureum]|uniref:CCHC-type domain-containing protein n=1 Tax=Porphyridium purpureum TaxID=35688 RepID=A0A5J4YTC5_PORPP|nr:hypothetical protein FVE85_2980 [Porphyridium purpureum]|eukprot:POR1653..scf227_4
MASGTRSQRETQQRAGADAIGSVANAWESMKSKNEDMQNLLDMCNESTNSEIEMLMVERSITLQQLRNLSIVCPIQWQQYCRLRGLPNFEAGTRIEDSFERYSPQAECKSEPEADPYQGTVAVAAQPSDHNKLQQFVRLFPVEAQFDGSDTGVPFTVWSRKVFNGMKMMNIDENTTLRALPLIVKGAAETCIAANRKERLHAALEHLRKEFDTEEVRLMRMLELRTKNFDSYLKRHIDVGSAFDSLVRDVTDVATRVGPPHDTPDCIASFVIQTMLNTSHGELIAAAVTKNSDAGSLARVRFVLVTQEKRKERTVLFQDEHTAKVSQSPHGLKKQKSFGKKLHCTHCGKTGHDKGKCWALYGKPTGYLEDEPHEETSQPSEDQGTDCEDDLLH